MKSGDPLIFGRAGEEIAALRSAGVPFAVVPGVTAALAAGASLDLPLTDRARATKLIFLTGHHAADKGGDKPLWQGALPEDATVVLYMPGRELRRVQAELRAAGLSGETPCAAVSHAATPRQTHAACRLESLDRLLCGPAPLLLLVGWALQPLLHHSAPLLDMLPGQPAGDPAESHRHREP